MQDVNARCRSANPRSKSRSLSTRSARLAEITRNSERAICSRNSVTNGGASTTSRPPRPPRCRRNSREPCRVLRHAVAHGTSGYAKGTQDEQDIWESFVTLANECVVDFVGGQRKTVRGIEPHAIPRLREGGAMELDVDPKDRPTTAVQDAIVSVRTPEPMVLYRQSSRDELFLLAVKAFVS